MNKVAIAIAAVVAGGLVNSAHAELYLGGKVGVTSLDNACELNTPCDDDSFGAGLHVGYDFNDVIALEYGVDYLGNYEANFRTGTNTVDNIDGDLWALTLAPKFNWHLNDQWNLFAKLGGAYMLSGDERDIVPTGSLGAEYTLDHNWSLRAEYQRYQGFTDDVIDDMDANFFGVGVNYKFGAAPAPIVIPVVEEVVVEAPKPVLMMKTHKEEFGSGTFELNSYTLTQTVSERLDSVVDFLAQYPQAQVEITGYTDSTGSAAYNQKLSERRAQAVADYLMSGGVSSARLSVVGMGEEDPIADNSTADGREKNRRVEVVIPEFQYEELVQPE